MHGVISKNLAGHNLVPEFENEIPKFDGMSDNEKDEIILDLYIKGL